MGRISTYNQDSDLANDDKVLGTDASGSKTRNYSLKSIIDFFNDAGLLSVFDGVLYQFLNYDTAPLHPSGIINVSKGNANNTEFSAITILYISNRDKTEQPLNSYLDALEDKHVRLTEVDNLNNFGIYSVTTVEDTTDGKYKKLTLQLRNSNGTFTKGKVYFVSNFSATYDVNLANRSVTDLSDVTDAGSGRIITSSERTNFQEIYDNGLRHSDVVDNLTSTSDDTPLSANQGKLLKELIDDINTLLDSDDTTLDELQEIVTYIKQNRSDLESLNIAAIAGLQDALDGKQAAEAGKGLSAEDFTSALKTKLEGIEAGSQVNVKPNWEESNTESDAFIQNKPTDITDLTSHNVTELTDVFGAGSGYIITDNERTKLQGIETSADVTDTTNVVAALTAGANVTIASNGTISSTDTNTQLSNEEVQDIAGPLVATGGTKDGITVTYNDNNGNIDFVVASQTDQNFTNALKTKLDGIETSADVTDTTNVVSALTAGSNITIAADGTISATVEAAAAAAAERIQAEVKNTSGALITEGTPVYITGNVGNSNRLEIAPADASDPAKMPAVGVLEVDLANNAEGYVIKGGHLKGIATATIDGTSMSSNDTIYVKPGGGLTATKPTGSNLIQNIAKVARVHASNGSIIVSSILRTNDVPNLSTGKIWVGSSSNTIESTAVHIDETNGRLGIGEDNPGNKLVLKDSGSPTLEINGQGRVNSLTLGVTSSESRLYENSNNALAFGTSGTERMRIDSSGNVDVNSGNIILRNGSLYAPTSGALKDAFIANDDGNLEFAVNGASNGVYGSISFIRRKGDSSDPDTTMQIDADGATSFPSNNVTISNGSLGIGMSTTPDSKLHVDFTADFDGLRIQNSNRGHNYLLSTAGGSAEYFIIRDVDNSRDLAYFGDSAAIFVTGGSEAMRIDSTGNVGIGSNLSNSGAGIELYPEWQTDTNLELHYDRGSSAYQNLITRAASHKFRLSSNTDAVTINSDGNVGIGTGTNSILGTLDVRGTYFQRPASNAAGVWGLTDSGGTTRARFDLDAAGDSSLLLRNSANTYTVVINSDGNSYFNGGDIGIGTTNPDAKLDVNGTIAFNSLKDTTENITITKFVDEADTIASNNNDTTIPTSAAVDAHIESKGVTDRNNSYKIMGIAMDYLSRVHNDGGTVEGMEDVMKNTEELILA